MLCSYRSVTCPPLLFVGRGACWMRLSFNIGVHGYRGRKIAALKADIRMLTERKDWYDSQISFGRLNAEEIQLSRTSCNMCSLRWLSFPRSFMIWSSIREPERIIRVI